MILPPGEKQLATGSVELDPSGRRGRLVLTNLRLVFEKEVNHGLLRGITHEPSFELALWQLYDLQVSKGGFGRPLLVVAAGGKTYRFRTSDSETWRSTIQRAHGSAPRPPPPPPPGVVPQSGAPVGVPVIVNVAAPPQGPPTVFLHCRHCGGINPAGAGVRCSACGGAL